MLVLVVGTLVLLWQHLGQPTSASNTAYSQFLANVSAGQVSNVVQ